VTIKSLGYDLSDEINWSFTEPGSGRPTIATFEEELELIGDRMAELLAAAKRRSSHGSSATIHNSIYAIRLCARAIARYARGRKGTEDWADAAVELLRRNSALSDGSRWHYFNYIRGILQEVARMRHEAFSRPNTFARRANSREPLLHGDALTPLIKQARRDALAIMTAIRNPDPNHAAFIEEARRLAAGGLFLAGSSARKTPEQSLRRRWRAETGLRLFDLTRHLYPSAQDLVPFLILLSYSLAANPDSLSLFRRDAIEPMLHPSRGPLLLLSLEKPRSGEIPQYPVRDAGTLSNGWLINALLEMTEPLVAIASESDKHYLFLCGTSNNHVCALRGELRATSMRQYLANHDLPKTTVKALRSARQTDEWIRTRDPFRIWRLSANSSLSVVAYYVLREESAASDAKAIADVQKNIITFTPAKPRSSNKVAGVLPSHTCADPEDGDKMKDENGLCASFLWPFNDVHFILLLEPRPVAYLLRDYNLLCEAEKVLPTGRFAKLYAPKKRKIEDDYLPLIDETLKAEALNLLPSLPPGPRVESL
jgi:hypothetical protein